MYIYIYIYIKHIYIYIQRERERDIRTRRLRGGLGVPRVLVGVTTPGLLVRAPIQYAILKS